MTDSPIPSINPVFDMLTLLRLLLTHNASPKALPTIINLDGYKYSPDLLVETYLKNADHIAFAPATTLQGAGDLWRASLRNQMISQNILFPTVQKPIVPICLLEDDSAAMQDMAKKQAKSMTGFVAEDAPAPLPKVTNSKSVASRTSKFLSAVNRYLTQKQYKRSKDIRTGEMRIISYEIRSNVKNPHLYPAVRFIATSNMSMILDVYVATSRLKLFNYQGMQPNQPTVPRSIVEFPYVNAVTQDEFFTYDNGLNIALLVLKSSVNAVINKARKTRTLAQVQK